MANSGEVAGGLRAVTRALQKSGVQYGGGLLGGEDGYGVFYENEVFGMHPYCWCEGDDCHWCATCTCPDGVWSYYVDGVKVSFEEFLTAGGYSAQNSSVEFDEIQACQWCVPGAVMAPNFWHKSTGTWVTWYKWIGRDTQILLQGDWSAILKECLSSIPPKISGSGSKVNAPAFGPTRE